MSTPPQDPDGPPLWGSPGDPPPDDVDLVVDFLLAEVEKRSGVNLSTNQVVRLRLREAAENAKKGLSSAMSARISVKYLEIGEDGPIHLDTTLTRAQLREIAGDDGVEDGQGLPPVAAGSEPSGSASSPGRPSSVVRRLGAAMLDVAVMLVPALLFGWAGGTLWAVVFGVGLLVGQLVLQGSQGWTVAQMLMRMRLVDQSTGEPVGTFRAVLRLSVVAAGGLVFVVGALAVLLSARFDRTGQRRGWHDVLTGTMVIDTAPMVSVNAVPSAPPARHRSQPIVAAVAVLVLCGVIWWAVSRSSGASSESVTSETAASESTASPTPSADPGPPTYTAELAPQVIADLVEVVGDTQFVSVTLGRGSAHAVALTGPGAKTTDDYSWSDGKASRDGRSPNQYPRKDLPDKLFDVTTVDWTSLQALADRMPDLTGISDQDVSVWVIRADTRADSSSAASFSTCMKKRGADILGTEDCEARVITDATGRIVWMRGGAPGSPASRWAAEGFLALVPQVVDDFVATAGDTQLETVVLDLNASENKATAEAVLSSTRSGSYCHMHYLSWGTGIVYRSSKDVYPGRERAKFDVTTVDWTLVETLLVQVPALTLTDAKSITVEVRRPDSDTERRASTKIVFAIEVKSNVTDENAVIVADTTGQIVWMEGGAIDSPADLWEAEHP